MFKRKMICLIHFNATPVNSKWFAVSILFEVEIAPIIVLIVSFLIAYCCDEITFLVAVAVKLI